MKVDGSESNSDKDDELPRTSKEIQAEVRTEIERDTKDEEERRK